jgi:alpha/beta superfamily hydrolase
LLGQLKGEFRPGPGLAPDQQAAAAFLKQMEADLEPQVGAFGSVAAAMVASMD